MKAKYDTHKTTSVGFGRTGNPLDDMVSPMKSKRQQPLLYDSDSSQEVLAEPSAVHQKRAKVAAQRRRMEKLSAEGGSTASGQAHERKNLLCSDGVTRIPYEVIGVSEMEITRINFVVCHDIFDSADMTKMLFVKLTKKHPGCQILLFNYPGQAGTTFPNERSNSTATMVPAGAEHDEPALNNDWISDRVHELMGHTDATGEFISSAQPFHMIGIGSGLPIALAFAEKYGESSKYVPRKKERPSLSFFLPPVLTPPPPPGTTKPSARSCR
jgi:hypothetical protein